MNSDTSPLLIIFSFIVLLLVIRRFFQWQRHKLWHETARLALEKGQPLPAGPDPDAQWRYWRGRRRSAFDFRRGVILLALGAGLYFSGPTKARSYALIPVFIGTAFVVLGVFSRFASDKADHERERDPVDRV